MHRPRILTISVLAAALVVLATSSTTATTGEKDPTSHPLPPSSPAAQPQPAFEDSVLDQGRYLTANGERFTYTKAIVQGREVLTYSNGTQTLDPAGMAAYEVEHPPPVLDPELAAAALTAAPGELVPAFVWLATNPKPAIARSLREERRPVLEALAQQVRAIYRAQLPVGSIPHDEELQFVQALSAKGGALTQLEKTAVESLSARIETETGAMRVEVQTRVEAAIAGDQRELSDLVASLGGTVAASISSVNGALVDLPAEALATLAADPRVARITPVPIGVPELNNQGASLGLTTGFWAANPVIDGGIWDAGVIDTGVQQNHPNLNHLTFLSTFGTTDSDGHGTGIAGIISSNHATNRGMAFGMDAMLVGSCSGSVPVTSGNSVVQHADWMVSTAAQDPEAINLSCGYGVASNTDYDSFEQFVDALIDDNSALLVKSTGNSGNGTTTITHPASAYNLIAVANMNDFNTVTRTDDVITSSSSRGPTLNGRKKPEISAPGNNTTSLNNLWATQSDFASIGGTSAAAPHVTGGAILLTELRGNDTPYLTKAILLNTADAWTDNGTSGVTGDDGAVAGSEWNKTYGWGYLDLWEAWFNGLDAELGSVDDGVTPAGPDFVLYQGTMFSGEKATVAWNRHLGYNGSNFPAAVESLTDLDLHVYSQATGASLDSSTSGQDNVEQVAVATAGDVVVRVDVFGVIDPDVGVETYGLSLEEGFTVATPPLFSRGWTTGPYAPGRPFSFRMSVQNLGTVPAFNNNLALSVPAGWSVNPPTAALPPLQPGVSEFAFFTVTPLCTTGTFPTTASFASTSYGEGFTWSSNPNVNLTTTALTNDVPLVSSLVARTFSFDVVSFDWHVVAVDAANSDRDVWADTDICMGSPYQTSTFGGTTDDFIVINGAVAAVGTHYGMVTFGSSGPLYSVETDQADDLSPGATGSETFDATEVVELYEVAVSAGTRFGFRVKGSSGSPDLSLHLYSPDRADGDRASADVSADRTGPDGQETVMFDAAVSGNYGVVVVNNGGDASTFTFEALTEDVFADGFESGNLANWDAVVP